MRLCDNCEHRETTFKDCDKKNIFYKYFVLKFQNMVGSE